MHTYKCVRAGRVISAHLHRFPTARQHAPAITRVRHPQSRGLLQVFVLAGTPRRNDNKCQQSRSSRFVAGPPRHVHPRSLDAPERQVQCRCHVDVALAAAAQLSRRGSDWPIPGPGLALPLLVEGSIHRFKIILEEQV